MLFPLEQGRHLTPDIAWDVYTEVHLHMTDVYAVGIHTSKDNWKDLPLPWIIIWGRTLLGKSRARNLYVIHCTGELTAT